MKTMSKEWCRPAILSILAVYLLAACGALPDITPLPTAIAPTPSLTSAATFAPTAVATPAPTSTSASLLTGNAIATESPTFEPTATAVLTGSPTPSSRATATPPATSADTSAPAPSLEVVELRSPLVVDSRAGRLYTFGKIDGVEQIVALAASDGRSLMAYGIVGPFGVDDVRGRLFVDRGETGLAVLDTQSGAAQTTTALPSGKHEWGKDSPAPLADPSTGQVLAFRDNVVYVVDPEKGTITSTIPFDVRKAENDCRNLSGPLPIEWATFDTVRRILYVDFETFVCAPWSGHMLLSYDMTSGAEIARRAVTPDFSATAFDGKLYGASWYRMGDGFRWAWRDGRPWFESSDWAYGAPLLHLDAARQRLYAQNAGGIQVFDARNMALVMLAPSPVPGQLAGYDPTTDQLYFLADGRLRSWPASAIQPPTPQPLAITRTPRGSVRSLLTSPAWREDKSLFAIWNAQDTANDCGVFGAFGGPLYISHDAGAAWSRARGGLLDGCDNIFAVAISPDYAHDRTLLAGVIGLGMFKSVDGGQLWQPSGAGLGSMHVEKILLSPGFATDRTAFALVAPAGGPKAAYRSRDGGNTWKALGISPELLATSPEFDQDHSLIAVVFSDTQNGRVGELRISRDGGDHWDAVGSVPGSKGLYLLSPAPLFEKWHVLFAFAGDGTLYRSQDGGKSWDSTLSVPHPIAVGPLVAPAQLLFAPDSEANRPVFLLVRVRKDATDPASERALLYRSGDGGLTWREVELPPDLSPTVMAISPNFSQDGLLFVGTGDGRVQTLEDRALR
ncbi:MAG: hypothetical protein ACM30E_08530 [Nitrososphaerales archaeon]